MVRVSARGGVGGLVLVGKTEGYNHAVYEDVERSKCGARQAGRGTRFRGRASGHWGGRGRRLFRPAVLRCRGLESRHEEAIGEFRRLDGARRGRRRLPCRAQARPVQAAPRSRAGPSLRGLQRHPVERLALQGSAGSSRRQASRNTSEGVRRSIDFTASFAYSKVAQDEALAQTGKLEPTELQRAIWAAYEASGMWWPCHKGVVFAERPVAVEKGGDRVGHALGGWIHRWRDQRATAGCRRTTRFSAWEPGPRRRPDLRPSAAYRSRKTRCRAAVRRTSAIVRPLPRRRA